MNRHLNAALILTLATLAISSCGAASSSSTTPPKGYYQADLSSYRLDQHRILDTFSRPGMPSVGSAKVLVIPVYFSGDDDPVPSSSDLDAIDKAYFGEADDTGWESLASYYKKSSYGKLQISGTVVEGYKVAKTAEAYETAAGTKYLYSIIALMDDAVLYAEKNLKIDVTDYDGDKDGYIDAVEMVYFTSRPLLSQGGADLWWAFTSNTQNTASVSSPVAGRFFWSPFSMIANGYYTPDIDTHTLVHETGHALGLNDYYSYDKGADAADPAGGVDMMDFNIGDHNAYSKMILGWCDPYVVDGTSSSFSITLKSFAETGECVILRDSKTDPWNGLPYDEYLLLQYYTPTALNEQDSTGYPEWEGQLGHDGTYSTYGLQLFHIDSRLFAYHQTFDPETYETLTDDWKYTDEITDEDIIDYKTGEATFASRIAASNTKSDSSDPDNLRGGSANRLVSIIPASKTTKFMSKSYLSSIGLTKNLFGVGAEYGSSTFSMNDYMDNFPSGPWFNDGSTLGYSFEVTSNDATSCSISFSAVA